jgi:hypothetical protein
VTSSDVVVNNNLALAEPSALQPGDLLIAAIHIENGTGELGNIDAGWIVVASRDQSSNLGMRVFRRLKDGPAVVDVHLFPGGGKKMSGGLVALRCVDGGAPVTSTQAGSSGNMSMASVSAPAEGLLLAFFGSKRGDATHTAPDRMQALYATGPQDFRSAGHVEPLAVGGATGTRTSGTSNGDSWVAIGVGVAPQPTAVGD